MELGSGGVELGPIRGRLGIWFEGREGVGGDDGTGGGGELGGGEVGGGAGGGAGGGVVVCGELLVGVAVGIELGFPHRMQLRRLVLARAMALEILTLA